MSRKIFPLAPLPPFFIFSPILNILSDRSFLLKCGVCLVWFLSWLEFKLNLNWFGSDEEMSLPRSYLGQGFLINFPSPVYYFYKHRKIVKIKLCDNS